MGLDACVYCDCMEQGKLLEPPRPEWHVFTERDGSRCCRDTNLSDDMEFDQWSLQRACPHKFGVLLHHYLGNITLIGMLRHELEPYVAELPILMERVIYNGIHSGDFLTLDQINGLEKELGILDQIHLIGEKDQYLRHFAHQLRELVECAGNVRKPIAF